MQKRCFCDTNVLMDYSQEILEFYDKVYISGYVLGELDKHKSQSIDLTRQFKAREAGRNLEKYKDKVEYIIRNGSFSLPLEFSDEGMDNKILQVFKDFYINNTDVVGLSNDLLFREKCKFLKLPCEKFEGSDSDNYTGYKEIIMDDLQMSGHYENPVNSFGLLNNEYLIIKDKFNTTVDRQRWTDQKGFIPINSKTLKSMYFEDIKPRDEYQMLAIDSLNTSDFTLLFGMAGSAKTLLSLGWIMQNIQLGKIRKCVIVFNSVPLKNNQPQGFYPGDRNQKLLQSALGGILSSKFGDMTLVENLIAQGKLMVIPSCDIRGIEISEYDCLYVTEAQNTDIYTMKTILQRPKCKIIVEGDMLEQQDIRIGGKNGMERAIEIFKGDKDFSCVKLKNTYRSHISEVAQRM